MLSLAARTSSTQAAHHPTHPAALANKSVLSQHLPPRSCPRDSFTAAGARYSNPESSAMTNEILSDTGYVG